MLDTILVPLDGSPLAERALPHAEALARAGGARLVLARAALAHGRNTEELARSEIKAVNQAETYLRGVETELTERGLRVTTAVPYGEAVEAILTAARTRQADLIVMSTHGRSGLGRWIYGSVAESVLARSPVPVMLICASSAEPAPASTAAPPKIIVPLDGSPFSEAALAVAPQMAATIGATLVLLESVAIPERAQRGRDGHLVAYVDQALGGREQEARYQLQMVAHKLEREQGVTGVEIDVRAGPPAESIARGVAEHGASLVVMATHGRTGLNRLRLGSVANETLHRLQVPLLLVRPVELREPAALSVPLATPAALAPELAVPLTMELSGRERVVLHALLDRELRDLKEEIHKTETIGYKDGLREREQILVELIERVGEGAAAVSA